MVPPCRREGSLNSSIPIPNTDQAVWHIAAQLNIPSRPDLTLFPDSRGFEENSEALNNPNEIRLGHYKSDALCGGRNPSVDQGPVLFGSEWISCSSCRENKHSTRNDKDLSL